MKRYGFFGGSFNPPTIAHERLAEAIAENFNLDKVYFVPVGDFYKKEGLLDEKTRYEMLTNIKNDKLDVLDIELNSNKSLSAVDAFKLINNSFNSSENFFIMGGDNLEKLPNWKHAENCLNYNIIAIQRGENLDSIINKNNLLQKHRNKIFEFNDNNLYNFSSTEVRKAIKIKDEEILSKMLNKKVYKYIEINNLYSGV